MPLAHASTGIAVVCRSVATHQSRFDVYSLHGFRYGAVPLKTTSVNVLVGKRALSHHGYADWALYIPIGVYGPVHSNNRCLRPNKYTTHSPIIDTATQFSSRKVVLSLQTLSPCADTESNQRSGTEWSWLARLPAGTEWPVNWRENPMKDFHRFTTTADHAVMAIFLEQDTYPHSVFLFCVILRHRMDISQCVPLE